MLASIIIPVFNRKELTLQCLDSLKATCNRENVEILVVDNASSDGSGTAIRDWVKKQGFPVILVENSANVGFARANNQAALLATGEFLICLNNDTIAEKGWLEALLKPLQDDATIGMTGALLLYADRKIQHAGVRFYRALPTHDFRLMSEFAPEVLVSGEKEAVTAACMAMRKSEFLAFGGFDEAFRNGYEDADLCIRIRKFGLKCWYAADAKLIHLESQTPGRMNHGMENSVLLFNRWADILADNSRFIYPDSSRRIIASKSEIETALTLVGEKPVRADENARFHFLRYMISFLDPEISEQIVRALLDEPESHPRWLLLNTLLLVKKQQIPEARASCVAYLKQFPQDREAELRLMEIHLLENQPARAKQILERLHRKEPASIEIGLMLKKVDAMMGEVIKPFEWNGAFQPSNLLTAQKPVFSIVMLTYNQWHHTEKCLQSLEMYSDRPYELILVDNASTDGTPEKLANYVKRHPNHKLILNKNNHGFPKGNNQGFSLASGEFVVWLNNDTIVTPEWMSRFERVFVENPNVGIAGPVTNYVNGIQLISYVTYFDKMSLEAFANEYFSRQGTAVKEFVRVVGFCLVHRKELLDKVGGLDEAFGRGNYEDDDFCVRAGQLGYSIVFVPGIFIHHTGSQTFRAVNEDYKKLIEKNGAYFNRKWGIPFTGPSGEIFFKKITVDRSGERLPLPDLNVSHAPDSSGCVFREL